MKGTNSILLNIFLITGYISVYIDKMAVKIYNSVFGIDYIVKTVSSCYMNIYNYLNCVITENKNDRWINISYISTKKIYPITFAYKEVYKHINLDTSGSLIKYKELLRKSKNYINNELVGGGHVEYEDLELNLDTKINDDNDGLSEISLLNTVVLVDKLLFKPHKLFILKLNIIYICRMYFERNFDFYIDYYNLSTTVKIQTLMYQHPKLKRDLVLKIPHGYYLNGNEILSSVFVARLLQQQYGIKNICFDSRYTLFGFDNKINMFKLNSDEYLKIGKNSFKIIKNDNVKKDK